MEVMKRGLALFLAVLMLMSALPMTVLAEQVDSETETTVISETKPPETTPDTEPPVEKNALPTEVTTAPTEATTAPTEETTAPTEETTAPTEETTAPTEATTAPTEATTAPTEETTAPTEETTAPTEETTAPTEETTAPTEETTAPTEETTTPTEETTAPTEETTAPTEETLVSDEELEEEESVMPPPMFSMPRPREIAPSCNIKWRDNMDADSTRPDMTDEEEAAAVKNAFSFTYTISKINEDGTESFYAIESVDENDTYKLIPADGKYQTEKTYDVGSKLDAVLTADEKSFDLNLSGLKESLLGKVGDDGETEQYQISYYVQQTGAVGGGYYLTDEHNNRLDGEHIPLDGIPQLYMTYFEPFEANIDWLDGGNRYGTQPGFDATGLKLMRYLYGSSDPAEPYESGNLRQEGGKLVTNDLPRYNEDGLPYVYYVELPKDDGKLSTVAQKDENKEEEPFNNVDSWYEPTVINDGDYNAVEDRLFEGGTVEYLLTNKTKFKVDKRWMDEETNPRNRPECQLVIYRTVVPDITKSDASSIFENCVVNPGYDRADVPKIDGTAGTGFIKVDKGEVNDLPMYNPQGLRYVYYAFETGLTGDYKTEILDNSSELYADGNLAELWENAQGQGYVINGGKIQNINKSQLAAAPTKIFEAASLQSMELKENTEVTVKLQWRPKNEGGKWQDYTEKVLASGEDDEQVWIDKLVTQTLKGFRPEEQIRHGTDVPVEKYDEYGVEREFRWVETSITVMGVEDEFTKAKDPVTGKPEAGEPGGFPIPDEDEYEFVWMNGLGADNTDVGFRIKRGPNGEIINNLRGVFEVRAKKNWSVCGLAYDPYSFELTAGEGENKVTVSLKDQQKRDDAIALMAKGIYNGEEEAKIADAKSQAVAMYDVLVAEAPVEQVQVEVLRDGRPLFRGIKGPDDPNPQFASSEEELRAMGYEFINQVMLNVRGDAEIPWEAATQLPRYDDHGRAYKYELKEVPDSYPDQWTQDELEETLGRTQVDIENDGSDKKHWIPQLSGEVNNTRGIVGGGKTFYFDVEKVWLDDSDIETRYPVQFSVYKLQNGEDGKKVLGEKVKSLTLTDKVNWKGRIGVDAVEGENITDYLVLEDGIIGKDGTLVPVAYDQGIPFILDTRGYITLDTFYANGGLDFEMVENLRSGKIEDPGNNLRQQYNVYIGNSKTTESEASYTVYNQRTAVIDMELTKRWVVGGDVDKIRDVEFRVKVTGGSFDGEKWLCEPMARFMANDRYSIGKGSPATFRLTKNDLVMDGDKPYREPVTDKNKQEAFLLRSVTLNNSLSNLRKYDTTGKILTYAPVETAMLRKDKSRIDLTNAAFPILVDGDYLITGMSKEVTYAEARPIPGGGGNYTHRTHDLYSYSASNIRSDTVPIILRKVWQDDGPGKRPDIYFKVYRCIVESDDPTDNLESVIAGKDAELVKEVKERSLWTTTGDGVNDWYWRCELENQPRYDEQGRPYIYFARESFLNGDANEYGTVYYNEKSDTTENLYPDPGGTDTEETFGHPHKDIYGGLSIILDGRNTLDWNEEYPEGEVGMVYYPAVTVNYLKDNQTLSGAKLWRMPRDQINVTKPPFDVALFKLTDAQNKKIKSHLNEQLLEKDAEGKYQITLDGEVIPAIGGQTVDTNKTSKFTFPGKDGEFIFPEYRHLLVWNGNKRTLNVLDDYGRQVHYYFGEYVIPMHGPDKDPEIEKAFSGHRKLVHWEMGSDTVNLINEFTPHAPFAKISVDKTLISNVDGVKASDLTAPITFQLYAKAQTGGQALMVAEVTVTKEGRKFVLSATDDLLADIRQGTNTDAARAKFTLTFHSGQFKADPDDQDKISQLPYYGPDGYPYTYFVKEKVPNGYKGETGESSLVRMGGKTETSFLNAWRLTKDQRDGYLVSDDIHPTDPDNDNTYEGSVQYKNTYWANKTEKTDLTVTKYWVGDGAYRGEYRPRMITLQLWRKNGDVEEPVRTNFKGEKIGAAKVPEENVTVSGGGSILLPEGDQEPVRIKITPSHAVDDAWSVTVNNLAKFAPDGTRYNYFVKEVDSDNANMPGDDYDNYIHCDTEDDALGSNDRDTPDTAKATNTLERVQVRASKTWKGLLPDGEEIVFNDDTIEYFRILHQLGALPSSISFHVESRPAPRNAKEDPEWVDDSHAEVKSWTLDSMDNAEKAFYEMQDLHWDNLAKYVDGTKRQRQMQYRVVESITWGTGEHAYTETFYKDGPNTSDRNVYAKVDAEQQNPDLIGDQYYAYQQKCLFTNTILIRKLEVHKYWADGNNQDGIRPNLNITVTRDAENGTSAGSYTFKEPLNNDWHYTDWIYVPLYKNGHHSPDPNGDDISIYTAVENVDGKYVKYYSPLRSYPEVCEKCQGETLYKKLKAPIDFDKVHDVYRDDHYGLNEKEGFINPDDGSAKCVERMTDYDTLGFENKNNLFVFANEQTTRKRMNLKAEKLWPEDPLGASQPDSIQLRLEYQIQPNGAWYIAGPLCGLESIDEATVTINANNAWTATWEGVFENRTDGLGANPIAYRVVEILNGAVVTDYSQFPYKVTNGTAWEVIGNTDEDDDLVNVDKQTKVKNELKVVELNLEKTFREGEYTDYLLPDSVSFRLWYKANGADWEPCELAGEYGVFNAFRSDGYKAKLSNLPQYDRENNIIEYAVSELTTDGSQEKPIKTDGSWSGESGAFKGSVTISREENGNWTVKAENDLPTTELIAVKDWSDEFDRDGIRGKISLVLKRDGELFLTVTYDPSHHYDPGIDPAPPALTVWDQNGDRIDAPFVNVAQTLTAEGAAQWIFSFTDLPMYKDDAPEHTDKYKSHYTLEETVLPTGYHAQVDGMTVTNTHTPDSFRVEAAKQWSDFDNHYGQRPEEVVLRLEFSLDGGETWEKVTTKALDPWYPDASGVYTTSANPQTITDKLGLMEDDASIWKETAKWENLRRFANVDGERIAIQYRVVELEPHQSYTPVIVTVVPLAPSEEEPVPTVRAMVTNTLEGVKTVGVCKLWEDGDNAFRTRPDSIQVQLQFRTSDGKWVNVSKDGKADLTAENNWQWGFINLREDFDYRVVEVSMTYGEEVVMLDPETGIVGAYASRAETHHVVPIEEDLEPGSIYVTTLINTLEPASYTVEKKWTGDESYLGSHRPVSVTVKLQSRAEETDTSLLAKLKDFFGGSSWEDVLCDGKVLTGQLKADSWKMTFGDLPKTDSLGKPLQYRAVEISMTMADGTVVDLTDSNAPYHPDGSGEIITNRFEKVQLTLTKRWEDFGDLYHTRPDSIEVTVTDQFGREYPDAQVDWKEKDGNSWTALISNLPKFRLENGKMVELSYTVTEKPVEDYVSKAVQTAGSGGKRTITNTLVMGHGDVTLIKYGRKEGGPKLADAVYRLVRVNEQGLSTYYTGRNASGEPEWSYFRSAAMELSTDKDGALSLTGLPYGRYRFEEIKAPKGYAVNKKPVEFTIDYTNRDTCISVFQVDKKLEKEVPSIPRTGDDIFPAITAMAASAAGLTFLLILRKRRRR